MPRKAIDRNRCYTFFPSDYLDDPVVRRMGVMGRGAYGGALLPALWHQPEPGVVEADDDLLASLAMCSPDEWTQVRDKVSRAFDVTTRPGYWIQKRMVAEHAAQKRAYNAKRSKGIYAASIRWASPEHASGNADAMLGDTGRRLEVGEGGESKESPPTPSPTAPASRVPPSGAGRERSASRPEPNGNGPAKEPDPDDLSTDEFFAKFFWAEYPRKQGRLTALREWRRAVGVGPRGQSAANRIVDALLSVSQGEWRGREERFIPYAHTWLKQRSWEES
jgi:uncharacterized protein YdaU (DUF1376 family)